MQPASSPRTQPDVSLTVQSHNPYDNPVPDFNRLTSLDYDQLSYTPFTPTVHSETENYFLAYDRYIHEVDQQYVIKTPEITTTTQTLEGGCRVSEDDAIPRDTTTRQHYTQYQQQQQQSSSSSSRSQTPYRTPLMTDTIPNGSGYQITSISQTPPTLNNSIDPSDTHRRRGDPPQPPRKHRHSVVDTLYDSHHRRSQQSRCSPDNPMISGYGAQTSGASTSSKDHTKTTSLYPATTQLQSINLDSDNEYRKRAEHHSRKYVMGNVAKFLQQSHPFIMFIPSTQHPPFDGFSSQPVRVTFTDNLELIQIFIQQSLISSPSTPRAPLVVSPTTIDTQHSSSAQDGPVSCPIEQSFFSAGFPSSLSQSSPLPYSQQPSSSSVSRLESGDSGGGGGGNQNNGNRNGDYDVLHGTVSEGDVPNDDNGDNHHSGPTQHGGDEHTTDGPQHINSNGIQQKNLNLSSSTSVSNPVLIRSFPSDEIIEVAYGFYHVLDSALSTLDVYPPFALTLSTYNNGYIFLQANSLELTCRFAICIATLIRFLSLPRDIRKYLSVERYLFHPEDEYRAIRELMTIKELFPNAQITQKDPESEIWDYIQNNYIPLPSIESTFSELILTLKEQEPKEMHEVSVTAGGELPTRFLKTSGKGITLDNDHPSDHETYVPFGREPCNAYALQIKQNRKGIPPSNEDGFDLTSPSSYRDQSAKTRHAKCDHNGRIITEQTGGPGRYGKDAYRSSQQQPHHQHHRQYYSSPRDVLENLPNVPHHHTHTDYASKMVKFYSHQFNTSMCVSTDLEEDAMQLRGTEPLRQLSPSSSRFLHVDPDFYHHRTPSRSQLHPGYAFPSTTYDDVITDDFIARHPNALMIWKDIIHRRFVINGQYFGHYPQHGRPSLIFLRVTPDMKSIIYNTDYVGSYKTSIPLDRVISISTGSKSKVFMRAKFPITITLDVDAGDGTDHFTFPPLSDSSLNPGIQRKRNYNSVAESGTTASTMMSGSHGTGETVSHFSGLGSIKEDSRHSHMDYDGIHKTSTHDGYLDNGTYSHSLTLSHPNNTTTSTEKMVSEINLGCPNYETYCIWVNALLWCWYQVRLGKHYHGVTCHATTSKPSMSSPSLLVTDASSKYYSAYGTSNTHDRSSAGEGGGGGRLGSGSGGSIGGGGGAIPVTAGPTYIGSQHIHHAHSLFPQQQHQHHHQEKQRQQQQQQQLQQHEIQPQAESKDIFQMQDLATALHSRQASTPEYYRRISDDSSNRTMGRSTPVLTPPHLSDTPQMSLSCQQRGIIPPYNTTLLADTIIPRYTPAKRETTIDGLTLKQSSTIMTGLDTPHLHPSPHSQPSPSALTVCPTHKYRTDLILPKSHVDQIHDGDFHHEQNNNDDHQHAVGDNGIDDDHDHHRPGEHDPYGMAMQHQGSCLRLIKTIRGLVYALANESDLSHRASLTIGPQMFDGSYYSLLLPQKIPLVVRVVTRAVVPVSETSNIAMTLKEEKFNPTVMNKLLTISFPHIVTFFGSFELDRLGFCNAFEYSRYGQVLHIIRAPSAPLPSEAFIAYVLYSCLCGLQYLHSNGLIHRNIACDSLVVNQQGYVKIDNLYRIAEYPYIPATLAEEMEGKCNIYPCPELRLGNPLDDRSDIWDVGITIIQIVNRGYLPAVSDYVDRRKSHPSDPFIIPGSERVLFYSPHLADFMTQCLKADPSARPSAADLLSHPLIVHAGLLHRSRQSNKQQYPLSAHGPGAIQESVIITELYPTYSKDLRQFLSYCHQFSPQYQSICSVLKPQPPPQPQSANHEHFRQHAHPGATYRSPMEDIATYDQKEILTCLQDDLLLQTLCGIYPDLYSLSFDSSRVSSSISLIHDELTTYANPTNSEAINTDPLMLVGHFMVMIEPGFLQGMDHFVYNPDIPYQTKSTCHEQFKEIFEFKDPGKHQFPLQSTTVASAVVDPNDLTAKRERNIKEINRFLFDLFHLIGDENPAQYRSIIDIVLPILHHSPAVSFGQFLNKLRQSLSHLGFHSFSDDPSHLDTFPCSLTQSYLQFQRTPMFRSFASFYTEIFNCDELFEKHTELSVLESFLPNPFEQLSLYAIDGRLGESTSGSQHWGTVGNNSMDESDAALVISDASNAVSSLSSTTPLYCHHHHHYHRGDGNRDEVPHHHHTGNQHHQPIGHRHAYDQEEFQTALMGPPPEQQLQQQQEPRYDDIITSPHDKPNDSRGSHDKYHHHHGRDSLDIKDSIDEKDEKDDSTSYSNSIRRFQTGPTYRCYHPTDEFMTHVVDCSHKDAHTRTPLQRLFDPIQDVDEVMGDGEDEKDPDLHISPIIPEPPQVTSIPPLSIPQDATPQKIHPPCPLPLIDKQPLHLQSSPTHIISISQVFHPPPTPLLSYPIPLTLDVQGLTFEDEPLFADKEGDITYMSNSNVCLALTRSHRSKCQLQPRPRTVSTIQRSILPHQAHVHPHLPQQPPLIQFQSSHQSRQHHQQYPPHPHPHPYLLPSRGITAESPSKSSGSSRHSKTDSYQSAISAFSISHFGTNMTTGIGQAPSDIEWIGEVDDDGGASQLDISDEGHLYENKNQETKIVNILDSIKTFMTLSCQKDGNDTTRDGSDVNNSGTTLKPRSSIRLPFQIPVNRPTAIQSPSPAIPPCNHKEQNQQRDSSQSSSNETQASIHTLQIQWLTPSERTPPEDIRSAHTTHSATTTTAATTRDENADSGDPSGLLYDRDDATHVVTPQRRVSLADIQNNEPYLQKPSLQCIKQTSTTPNLTSSMHKYNPSHHHRHHQDQHHETGNRMIASALYVNQSTTSEVSHKSKGIYPLPHQSQHSGHTALFDSKNNVLSLGPFLISQTGMKSTVPSGRRKKSSATAAGDQRSSKSSSRGSKKGQRSQGSVSTTVTTTPAVVKVYPQHPLSPRIPSSLRLVGAMSSPQDQATQHPYHPQPYHHHHHSNHYHTGIVPKLPRSRPSTPNFAHMYHRHYLHQHQRQHPSYSLIEQHQPAAHSYQDISHPPSFISSQPIPTIDSSVCPTNIPSPHGYPNMVSSPIGATSALVFDGTNDDDDDDGGQLKGLLHKNSSLDQPKLTRSLSRVRIPNVIAPQYNPSRPSSAPLGLEDEVTEHVRVHHLRTNPYVIKYAREYLRPPQQPDPTSDTCSIRSLRTISTDFEQELLQHHHDTYQHRHHHHHHHHTTHRGDHGSSYNPQLYGIPMFVNRNRTIQDRFKRFSQELKRYLDLKRLYNKMNNCPSNSNGTHQLDEHNQCYSCSNSTINPDISWPSIDQLSIGDFEHITHTTTDTPPKGMASAGTMTTPAPSNLDSGGQSSSTQQTKDPHHHQQHVHYKTKAHGGPDRKYISPNLMEQQLQEFYRPKSNILLHPPRYKRRASESAAILKGHLLNPRRLLSEQYHLAYPSDGYFHGQHQYVNHDNYHAPMYHTTQGHRASVHYIPTGGNYDGVPSQHPFRIDFLAPPPLESHLIGGVETYLGSHAPPTADGSVPMAQPLPYLNTSEPDERAKSDAFPALSDRTNYSLYVQRPTTESHSTSPLPTEDLDMPISITSCSYCGNGATISHDDDDGDDDDDYNGGGDDDSAGGGDDNQMNLARNNTTSHIHIKQRKRRQPLQSRRRHLTRTSSYEAAQPVAPRKALLGSMPAFDIYRRDGAISNPVSSTDPTITGTVSDDMEGSKSGAQFEVKLTSNELVELDVVGRGQSGAVTLALHIPTISLLAIKKIQVHDPNARGQLSKELHAYSRTNSPFVMKLRGAFLDDSDKAVLASDYMDMGSLKSFVNLVGGPLPEFMIAYIARASLIGLDYLHSLRCVHRDIKPDNILINSRGHVQIADLGLLVELESHTATVTNFLGTLTYLSPERIRVDRDGYGLPSDIYSLGLTFIFCATGKHMYVTADYWTMLDLINTNPPCLPPDNLDPSKGHIVYYSPELRDLIRLMVSYDPAERPTAHQLLQHPFFSLTFNIVPSPRSVNPCRTPPLSAGSDTTPLHGDGHTVLQLQQSLDNVNIQVNYVPQVEQQYYQAMQILPPSPKGSEVDGDGREQQQQQHPTGMNDNDIVDHRAHDSAIYVSNAFYHCVPAHAFSQYTIDQFNKQLNSYTGRPERAGSDITTQSSPSHHDIDPSISSSFDRKGFSIHDTFRMFGYSLSTLFPPLVLVSCGNTYDSTTLLSNLKYYQLALWYLRAQFHTMMYEKPSTFFCVINTVMEFHFHGILRASPAGFSWEFNRHAQHFTSLSNSSTNLKPHQARILYEKKVFGYTNGDGTTASSHYPHHSSGQEKFYFFRGYRPMLRSDFQIIQKVASIFSLPYSIVQRTFSKLLSHRVHLNRAIRLYQLHDQHYCENEGVILLKEDSEPPPFLSSKL